jgi:hypothetical protein
LLGDDSGGGPLASWASGRTYYPEAPAHLGSNAGIRGGWTHARSPECHSACQSPSDPCGLASQGSPPLCIDRGVTAALLLCHRCRSEKGVDRAPTDAWSSSDAVAPDLAADEPRSHLNAGAAECPFDARDRAFHRAGLTGHPPIAQARAHSPTTPATLTTRRHTRAWQPPRERVRQVLAHGQSQARTWGPSACCRRHCGGGRAPSRADPAQIRPGVG